MRPNPPQSRHPLYPRWALLILSIRPADRFGLLRVRDEQVDHFPEPCLEVFMIKAATGRSYTCVEFNADIWC